MRTIILTACLAMPCGAETPQCAPVNDALDVLESRYSEHPRVSGLTSAGVLMIVTASEGGGFSVLLVSPDGQACMVASGANFVLTDAPKPGVVN